MGIIDNNTLLFQAPCYEKRSGRIIRSAYILPFTRDNLSILWQKAQKYPTLMGVEINSLEDLMRFFVEIDENGELLSKGLCAVVDDFTGIFWLTDIDEPTNSASVHYTFFDGVQRGRTELAQEALRYLFNTYKFSVLWTSVPLYAKYPLNFIERIGFKKVKREPKKASLFGVKYDIYIYEIRPEDLEDGIR